MDKYNILISSLESLNDITQATFVYDMCVFRHYKKDNNKTTFLLEEFNTNIKKNRFDFNIDDISILLRLLK